MAAGIQAFKVHYWPKLCVGVGTIKYVFFLFFNRFTRGKAVGHEISDMFH